MQLDKTWDLNTATHLCRELERYAPDYGAHIALTGGCLYKDYNRKDVDILVYRIRQVEQVDWDGFFAAINKGLGITVEEDHGWVKKAITATGKLIDFFDPEDTGEYT